MTQAKLKDLLYLSEKRTIFIGRLTNPLPLFSAAPSFFVSIDKEIELIDHINNKTYFSKTFLLPPGIKVSIDTHGSVISHGFLDVMGFDLASLTPKMQQTISIDQTSTVYSDFYDEDDAIKRIQFIWNTRPSATNLFAEMSTWLNNFEPGINFHPDKRVIKAVSIIQENYRENISVADIAHQVGLSEPHLCQLFKNNIGIPIRRYRIWYRIYIIAIKMGLGLTLTDAVIEVGFTDSAQFSRVFKEIGGIKPSDILTVKANTDIRILA
ncbi:MAG: AraC-like DNA-binding protein [Oleiphilaceae bacterium]|jgi:AraC-like DNA-binding protein